MSRKPKHIHKYHRITLKFGQIWACALPTCNHHMPNVYEETLPGKASLCWKCDGQFILTEDKMKDDQPLCNDCKPSLQSIGEILQNSKKAKILDFLDEVMPKEDK
jgi:hypothetical protein